MKRKDLAEKVAAKVGEPPITVVVNEGIINPAPYLRARVFIDLEKPLVRVIPITLRLSKRYLVQYEKLPIFCNVCGLVGHEMTECGDGVHEEGECEWGDWLLVKFASGTMSRNTPFRGDSRGGAWGRGRGRGRGQSVHSDSDERPDHDMEVEDNTKDVYVPKKRPGAADGSGMSNISSSVAEKVYDLEKGSVENKAASPNAKQEKKRLRKEETGNKVVPQPVLSAPSTVEGDRSQ
jgi:hypothetical protein